MLPELTILRRVREVLLRINGAAPYSTSFGGRVSLWRPVEVGDQLVTPVAFLSASGIDPGTTDGARSITVSIMASVGPDYWDARSWDPEEALLRVGTDIRRALHEYRDLAIDALPSPLYRGANSSFVRQQHFRLQEGDSRLGLQVDWRYVFHDTGVVGP